MKENYAQPIDQFSHAANIPLGISQRKYRTKVIFNEIDVFIAHIGTHLSAIQMYL